MKSEVSKIETLQDAIESLSEDEYKEFRDWLVEEDWRRWDRQFEADVKAGKLDFLADEALRAHRNDETTPL